MTWLAVVAAGVAMTLLLGRSGYVRDAGRWLIARPWFGGGLALVVAATGIWALWRRHSAEVPTSPLALRLHDLDVRRREEDLGASQAHREEMAELRRQVEKRHGAAARVRMDREAVLSAAQLDDAVRMTRERARELGL